MVRLGASIETFRMMSASLEENPKNSSVALLRMVGSLDGLEGEINRHCVILNWQCYLF